MKDYSTYAINDHMTARLLSGRPYQSFYLQVNYDTQAQQTLFFLEQALVRFGGWTKVEEFETVLGWRMARYTKGGEQWTDEERGANVFQALFVLENLNVGPVPMTYLG